VTCHAIRTGALALAVMTAAGCAPGLGDAFKAPDIGLNQVVVRGIGMSGGTLDLVLDVCNPNNFTLQGTKLRVGFDVDKSHVGDITYDDDFTVTQRDTSHVTLPLTFEWSGVGGAVRTALGYGDIPYTLKGEAEIDTPFGRRKVPFTRSGRAPLTRAGGGVTVPVPGR
jgi:LEA14-like dessication related protein